MLQVSEAVIHLNIHMRAADLFPAAFRACLLEVEEEK